MAKVLVSAPMPGPALERLGAEHAIAIGDDARGLGKAGLLARAGDADAIVSMVTDVIDAEVLANAPRLRVIGNAGVGVDKIDLAACRARGVVVTNAPDVLTDATADLAFALILDAARRVSEGDRLVRAGGFDGFSLGLLLGARVTGATLGVLGLGRIGRAVAERAKGFRMRVLYAQRSRAPEEVERALGAERVSVDELFARSDVLTLHCPLTDATRGIASRARVFAMKPVSVLVNTSRGACVDEAAVAEALARGHLAGAALDVFVDEPRVPPALLAEPRAVLTPHIGSADRPTREAMASLAVEGVLDVLAGRAPRHRVA